MASLLSPNERSVLATDLAHWSMVSNRDAITRSYQFKDFKEA
ncbi:MAG: 4a-hydroxytetrahydrobiopterin dehydratase, partial [Burkholderiaceae bacterium]|nr:4a-hydroxytetrahydrobiopterin dehydratase [Burkholderiaceae bacterium]